MRLEFGTCSYGRGGGALIFWPVLPESRIHAGIPARPENLVHPGLGGGGGGELVHSFLARAPEIFCFSLPVSGLVYMTSNKPTSMTR